MKYRMYVDEVGNVDMKSSMHPNERYLSLTGVIIELEHVADVLSPRLEALKKKHLGSHPDDPIVLHRQEMRQKKPPFAALQDPIVCTAFDAELMTLVIDVDYVVVTAVIDKLEHLNRYGQWANEPYHYCLEVLIERYVLWLGAKGGRGDVMAESRGGREDRQLKAVYSRIHTRGTYYVKAGVIQADLTSRELKIKPKAANVAGLQFADVIAYPSHQATIRRRNNEALPTSFSGQIAQVLEATKYRRSYANRIDGWGRVFLPR